MFSSALSGCLVAFWPIALNLACITSSAHAPAEEARGSSPSPAASTTPVTSTSSAAIDLSELGSRVEKLLDQLDASEADWQRLGPGALAVLEKLCKDSAKLPAQRARAVDALALVNSPEASLRLKTLLSDSQLAANYRSRAAAAFGQREGSGATPALRPLLVEASPQLRESAIRALTKVGGEEARRALEERLPREEEGNLRELIQRSLGKLQP